MLSSLPPITDPAFVAGTTPGPLLLLKAVSPRNPLARRVATLVLVLLGALASVTRTPHAAEAASPTPTRPPGSNEVQLLNASFDISRELFNDINQAFAAAWKEKTGGRVSIHQSHGGSSKQARAVVDGLAADVVTFNQVLDIDMIAARGGLVPKDWRTRFPHQSSPFTSTVVFLVRKGNPKNIRDWPDLTRSGVSVVIPNPKTSGNGRYGYLAAWGYALKKLNLNQAEAQDFVGKLFQNVPVLDTGGRGSTATFAQKGIGDVLVTFEAEAFLAFQELGADKFEIVSPSFSIEAEMPVAVVEAVARRRGTEAVARAYLEFLYSEPAQEIVARHHYRPRLESVARRNAEKFGEGRTELFTVDDLFGGWVAAQRDHFAEGASFDRLIERPRP